ncbi:MAG: NADP-dependent 3-hydroxy acid dehydrogenase YdfG [Halioglobus sp.]|jgi:NADP-dependent 3-hydroxy acid dehydrogenase YdfG
MNNLGSFSISAQDSLDFARTSGDFNPLHLDPVAARRTQFGQTLIHGVCGTLKALDLLLANLQPGGSLKRIKVKYSKPVTQGQELTVTAQTTDNSTRLEVFAGTVRIQIIDVEFGAVYPDATELRENRPPHQGCDELTISGSENLSGAVEFFWNRAGMAAQFPNAVQQLPETQLATLLASTYIVGMKCPGLHSVFAQLEIDFGARNTSAATTQLEYKVTSTDARIDQVQLSLCNAYAVGTIEAFFRAPPALQASFDKIAQLVAPDEFRDQNALVVGASRGLGEVIGKVLAAGGATTMLTYASGIDDTNRVAQEIAQHRNAPGVTQYNVLQPSASQQLADFMDSLTHIYYLASPTISKGEARTWDATLFSKYCDFYVHGMAATLQLVDQHAAKDQGRHLFIPSSIFLEEKVKGFNEYIAAKTAAEAFAQRYVASNGQWQVAAPRLPRLHSDQTSGVRGTSEEKNLEVIVAQLRELFGKTP